MFAYKERLKEVNQLAIPLIINSISSLLIGLVDQAMVGRISLSAYSAVGVVSTTIYSITGILGMFAVAFNILGAKKYGDENQKDLNNEFKLSILISIIIGALCFLIFSLCNTQILKLFFGLSGDVLTEAIKFMSIYSITIGLNMIIFVFSSYFKIINKTKIIFYGSLIAGVVNIFLDYIFIFGNLGFAKMGVTGAAIGSSIALFSNIIFYIIFIKDKSIFSFKIKNAYESLKEIVFLGLPLMGQEFLEGTIFIIAVNAIVSRIGVLELSVFTLLFSITNIVLMPMYGYSSASLTLVSQKSNIEKEIKIIPQICLFASLMFYIIFLITSVTMKDYLPCLITNDINLIKNTAGFIPVAIIMQLFNFPHSVYKYSLQGLREEKWVFKISVAVNILSILLISIFVYKFKLNLLGIYIGIGFNYLLLSILFYLKYKHRVNIIKRETTDLIMQRMFI